MLKAILRSFAWGYGRSMGRKAANATSFIALPILLLVVVLGVMELSGTGFDLRSLLPYFSGGW